MNSKILLLAISVAALSSCSTAYKNGQTPDDVYYSPERPQSAYVQAEKQQDESFTPADNYARPRANNYRSYSDPYAYDNYDDYRNDRFLRMSIGSPYRLSAFNDYYWNDWRFNNMGFNTMYNWYNYSNPYAYSFYWNSFYNPYARNYVFINPKSPTYNIAPPRPPVIFNRNAYTNRNYSNTNTATNRTMYNPHSGTYNYNSGNTSRYNNNNNGSTQRSYSQPNYSNSNNNRSSNTQQPSYSAPTRTYTPSYTPSSSSSSSSGSSSGSGSSGGGSRPVRGR
jgi:hypothetical protein